jgi:cobalamin synthase
MGIRERSRHAAAAVFAIFTLSTIALASTYRQFPGIVSVVISALLLANIRATWLAATSQFSREAFDRDRLNSTFLDKLTDQWPAKLWPVLQWLFWILFAGEALLVAILFALPVLLPFARMVKPR